MWRNKAIAFLSFICLLLVVSIASLMGDRKQADLVLDVIEANLVATQDKLESAETRLSTAEVILLETIDTSLLWERKFDAVYGFLMVVDRALVDATGEGIFGNKPEDTKLLTILKTRLLIAEKAEGVTK